MKTNPAFRFSLSLGTRLALNIGLVIALASLFLFVGLYRQEEQRAMQLINKQAESLLSAMVVVREWVSSYKGIWTASPGEIFFEEKNGYYLKTPAMVTKELSLLTDTKGYYRFHITSLQLVNPDNAPDTFEHHALTVFEANAEPFTAIEQGDSGEALYRLMIPLKAEESCLRCHSDLGYQPGDVRGGLSVILPMDEINASLADSRQSLAFSAAAIAALVMAALYFLTHRAVVLPVRQLTRITEAVGRGDYEPRSSLVTGNELQTLGDALNQMIVNLQNSRNVLHQRIEQRTLELAAISDVAQAVSSSNDLQTIMTDALARVIHSAGVDGGAVHLVDGERMDCVSSRNLQDHLLTCLNKLGNRAELFARLTAGETFVLTRENWNLFSENCADEDCPNAANRERSLALVPLLSRGQTHGILTLHSRAENKFSAETLQLLNCIGNQLGVAIENARYQGQVEQMAILEERQRISRELHDSLAQTLSWLNIKVEILESRLQSGSAEKIQDELANVHRVVRDACYDVRESIDGLRHPADSLPTSIAVWIAAFRKSSGLAIEYQSAGGDVKLPPVVEAEALRILQEALTNVRKHAQASQAWVALQIKQDFIELTVEDNGIGLDAAAKDGHFGLRIMRERAERLKGSFEAQARSTGGTRILARIPLRNYSRI